MGVKDLWQVLSPVCERKSLWELQDKIIAVDLSCWVCDSQNVAEYSTQPNMYLRNLFFRTSALLLLGAHPIFILEGDAPLLKANVMEQRNAARGFTQSQKEGSDQSNKGKRRQYKTVQKKCCELLDCMGVKYVQSEGEAEALCALLNRHRLVDGCISQDSDCFLYGAKVVYRNFSTTSGNSSTGGPGFSVDSYNMTAVENSLGLTRNKLIALSLLCGCDYIQQGVAGVGKESALKFIATVEDAAVLDRLRKWRDDFYFEQLEEERRLGGCEQCGHVGKLKTHLKEGCSYCQVDKGCTPSFNPRSLCQMEVEKRKLVILELAMRKKALLDPEFPSEEIIEEFLRPKVTVPSKLDTKWEQPNIVNFLRLAVRFLRWEETYAFDKFLPILTRWVLLWKGKVQNTSARSCPVIPLEIKRARVLRGIASYEIKWGDTEGLFDSLLTASTEDTEVEAADKFCTIEPKRLVEEAYPELVNKFTAQREEEKQAKRKAKSKSKKVTEKTKDEGGGEGGGCDICGGHEGCLCRFTRVSGAEKANKENRPQPSKPQKNAVKKPQNRKPKVKTDEKQRRLSSFLNKNQKEATPTPTPQDIPLEELFDTSLNLLDMTDDYDEADLSAIVMSIVGAKAGQSKFPMSSTIVTPDKESPVTNLPEQYTVKETLILKTPETSSSSDEDIGAYIPLRERIRMKNQMQLESESTGTGVSSPVCKKFKSDSITHPYSPLMDDVLPDSPAPNKRRSILKSEAARRFSASIEAFSRPDSPLNSANGSVQLAKSPMEYREINSTNRFSIGFNSFLDNYE